MAKRATLDEVKEFCNEVRKAGGANPLDALMPAVPEKSDSCLIARNLNFSCEVNGIEDERWGMTIADVLTAERIAKALDLELDVNLTFGCATITLPKSIGQVAADFDLAGKVWRRLSDELYDSPDHAAVDVINEWRDGLTEDGAALLREMLPYIEAAEQEIDDFKLADVLAPWS